MKKFLMCFVFLAVLSGVSFADIVYTTSAGKLGYIKISGTTSADLEGIKNSNTVNDPFSVSYKNDDNKDIIMLINRTDDETTSGDSVQRFSPSDLTKELDEEQKYLTGLYGAELSAYSKNGRSIFFTSGSKIFDFYTDDLRIKASFDCTVKSSDLSPKITGIATGNNNIFVLADYNGESDDRLLIFDGRLTASADAYSSWTTENDTSSMEYLNDSRIAVGHSEGVDIFSRGIFTKVLSSDNPVVSICRYSDSQFYYVTQSYSETDDQYTDIISYYPSSEINISTSRTSDSSNVQLVRDETYNTLCALVGDQILLYQMSNGNLFASYNSTQLGGIPVNIAAAKLPSTDGSSSSSGCETFNSGILLMILCSGLIRKLRR